MANEQGAREEARRLLADRIVQDVAELPDRTSPDDWPEAMLVTSDELRQIISDELATPASPDALRELIAKWQIKADQMEADGIDIARDSGARVTHPFEWEASRLRDCADELEALLGASEPLRHPQNQEDALLACQSKLTVSAPPSTPDVQDSLLHPAHQVYFRAGLIACREYMARFVEAQDPNIAMSIRANWWPRLGEDYGPPRQLDFAEVTEGQFGTPAFRCKTAEEVSPTQEALPIALEFLQWPGVDGGEPTISSEESKPANPDSRSSLGEPR